MNQSFDSQEESGDLSLVKRWSKKFGYALRGCIVAFRQEDSFAVHLPMAFMVLAYGIMVGLGRTEWLLLVLCVAIVISAELFNSSIERLATTITQEVHPSIRDALDMAAGAVLVVSIGAALVGLIILSS